MFRRIHPLIGALRHCTLWLTSSWSDIFVENPNYNKHSANQKSIYCVHGTFDRAGSFSVIAEGLKGGLPDNIKGIHLLTFSGSITTESIESYAAQLKDKIAANHDDTVILMGHSRGALVVSTFAEELAAGNNINIAMVVGICGPFKGSHLAVKPLAAVSKSIDQMQVGSDFLEKLAASIKESKVNYYFVGAKDDYLVIDNAWHPYDDEGYDRVNLLYLDKDAHLSIQSSPDLILWLSALLSLDAIKPDNDSEPSSPTL